MHSRRAPVLVKLGQFHKGADPAAVAGVSAPSQENRFLEANRNGALVLILDAFDEMGKADPKQTLNESFERLTSGLLDGKAKVILTCRKEFFRDEKEEDRIPSDKVIAASAEKVEVQLFDERRIQDALRLRNRAPVFDQIKSNPRVLDLARRPVLLDLIAQYNAPFDSSTKLADLYEKYIDRLLARGPDDRLAYQRREFAEKIAWKIQNSGPLPAAEVEEPLKAMGFMDEADRFRSRSLLVRQVNDYVFGHASFREYLVAKQVIPYLQKGRFVECKLSDPTIEFIREIWTWPPQMLIEKDGMVFVPPGPFIFGDADSARIADLKTGVWIDKYPVTNQQYLEFLQSVGRKNIDKAWIDHEVSRITKNLTLVDPKYSDHPVTGVSWFGAKAYAESPAVGKRLPTEEEWEKAARGMDGRRYPWGDGFNSRNANTHESKIGDTSRVSQHEAGQSPYGALDMAGNVWEWTASEDGSSKILRGGSWFDFPVLARCAFRDWSLPEDSNFNFGFRCART
jgi:serine/threonine-protein kinase